MMNEIIKWVIILAVLTLLIILLVILIKKRNRWTIMDVYINKNIAEVKAQSNLFHNMQNGMSAQLNDVGQVYKSVVFGGIQTEGLWMAKELFPNISRSHHAIANTTSTLLEEWMKKYIKLNEEIRIYNQEISTFPNCMVAKVLGFKEFHYQIDL